VISVHLRGHQPNSTTNGIDLYFTHINAKQGRVPFNNGSLKVGENDIKCFKKFWLLSAKKVYS